MDSKEERLISIFKKYYSPAGSIPEADEFMTTQAIYDKFFQLSYDPNFTIDKMQDLLERHGYVFDYFLDEFVWLLKVRNVD